MRKSFCDKCGKEITVDVEWVFNHELCPECAKAVDIFITHPSRPSTIDVQLVKREKWKAILYDAVKELEYYETHGDLLDRHIWKYKNEALALIGEDGDTNE